MSLSSRRSTATASTAQRGAVRTTTRRAPGGGVKCNAESASEAAGAGSSAGGDKMVIAITGATGFVGKKLVEELMAEGHEVRVLTRNNVAARLALPQAALGGAKFYAHANDASVGVVAVTPGGCHSDWLYKAGSGKNRPRSVIGRNTRSSPFQGPNGAWVASRGLSARVAGVGGVVWASTAPHGADWAILSQFEPTTFGGIVTIFCMRGTLVSPTLPVGPTRK
jgi:hypothetical protein